MINKSTNQLHIIMQSIYLLVYNMIDRSTYQLCIVVINQPTYQLCASRLINLPTSSVQCERADTEKWMWEKGIVRDAPNGLP